MKYFIEYNFDSILPRSGDTDLVKKYFWVIKESEKYSISMFDNKVDMFEEVAEQASYARHGAEPFEQYGREEMEDLIAFSIEEFGG